MSKKLLTVLVLGSLIAVGAVLAATGGKATAVALPVVQPALDSYQLVGTGTTPPAESVCFGVHRRCFTPQSMRSAYNLAPLYAQNRDGRGQTIAIVDSYGSDTMAHDLHVFDQAFNLQPMCGEEGVTCAAGMPTFSQLDLQGSPATTPQGGQGTGLENKTGWAIEVVLDVEWAHAIAPGANILLVHTPTAETLGVQGFPQMMKAEDYVVKNHLATVISQSFGSSESAFGSSASLLSLRNAFIDAAASKVTVLASSGDFGSTNQFKQSLLPADSGAVFPFPNVGWPASDPLVTSVGGTYLCTNPNAAQTDPRTVDSTDPPATCQAHPGVAEVGWIAAGGGFSSVFTRPSYQDTLPSGSTAIPATSRGVPDVAYQASSQTGDLVYVSLPPDGSGSNVGDSGWYLIGGTSASSPQWAGLVAIADQINNNTGLGLINPALYKIGANPTRYAADFYDVTTGNNGLYATATPPVPGYPATTGWDPVTGLGTPNAATFLPDLVAAVNGH
jgi:subtilase family serine protease